MEKEIMTVSEFASIHGVTKAAVYYWIKSGMPLERDRPRLINLAKANGWLESRSTMMKKPKMYKPNTEEDE